jgi:hypothetical protein
MARLSYVQMDQVSPKVREIYGRVLRGKPVSWRIGFRAGKPNGAQLRKRRPSERAVRSTRPKA